MIKVNVRIQPTVVNLFKDVRHRYGHLISRGMYSVLDALGFAVDWHGSKPSGTQRKYREVKEVEVDQDQLLAFYAATADDSVDYSLTHRITELRDSRSSSIQNGEHVLVQGQDVILTANTVVGTRREFYVSLFNPLEYSVLVRLIDYTGTLSEELVPCNQSRFFSFSEDGELEGIIPPSGRLQLGPLVFSPTEPGTFAHYFVIMNNYTGLEPVMVAGCSILQPLLLRDGAGYLDKVGVDKDDERQELRLSVKYSGLAAQSRDDEINRNIMSYYRIEVSLRRDYTLRLMNVTLLTEEEKGTARSHVIVKHGSFLSAEKRAGGPTDNKTRELTIPHTGIPRQLLSGFGEFPRDGIVLNGDSHVTLLLTNYPLCLPSESLILRVGCDGEE